MPKAWRKVDEIEECPECSSVLIVIHNDSNVSAYAKCEDCEHETPLRFLETYIYGKHGNMPVGQVSAIQER